MGNYTAKTGQEKTSDLRKTHVYTRNNKKEVTENVISGATTVEKSLIKEKKKKYCVKVKKSVKY